MNTVNIIGNLTRNVETRQTEKALVANFTLAVSNPFQKDHTDFIRCVAWGKTAEVIRDYSKKGDKFGIEGRIQVRQYEKDGQTRQSVEVNVNQVHFLTPKSQEARIAAPHDEPLGDELPF